MTFDLAATLRAILKEATGGSGPTADAVHVPSPNWKPKGKKKPPTATIDKVLKAEAEQRYCLGVVYEPMVVDSQGDFATAEEIEACCRAFNLQQLHMARAGAAVAKMAAGQTIEVSLPEEISKGALGLQHADWSDDIGDIVESYIAPADMVINGQAVTKGTWLMGIILAPDLFADVKAGKLTGLSMGGSAVRTPVKDVTDA